MRTCCNAPAPTSTAQVPPAQVNVLDWSAAAPSLQVGNASDERLLDGMLHVTPRVLPVSRDLWELLKDLGDRQDESFRRVLRHQQDLEKQLSAMSFSQVLCQQQELEKQMSAMTLAFKTNTETQAHAQTRHEDHFAEFHRLLKKHPSQDATEVITMPGTGEAVDDGSANPVKQSVPAVEENGSRVGDSVETSDVYASEPRSELSRAGSRASRKKHKSLIKIDTSKSCDSLASVSMVGARVTLWQHRIQHLLHHKEFEFVVAVIILLNAFTMCWESQYQGLEVGFNLQYPGRAVEARVAWPGAAELWNFFDWFFGCLFCLEMALKLVFWRGKYFYVRRDAKVDLYYSSSQDHIVKARRCQGWDCLASIQYSNLLDFFCNAAFVFAKLASVSVVKPQTLRLLRLFRLGRLVRLLRFLKSLDHLYIMTTAISALRHVLTWAIVLLSTILVTCDLFLIQILQSTYFDQAQAGDLTEDQLEKYRQVYAYFGTWTRCMLSMFEITLGNWPPVARILMEEVSEWFIVLCLVHKLTVGFAVVGVINGVILQETFKVAQTDDLIMYREKHRAKEMLRKKFQALFDELDEEGTGELQISNIEHIADLPEIKTWLGSLGIETSDLKTLFMLLDADGSGSITLEELISRLPRIQGAARSLDVLAIERYIWKHFAPKGKSRQSASGFSDFLFEDSPVRQLSPDAPNESPKQDSPGISL